MKEEDGQPPFDCFSESCVTESSASSSCRSLNAHLYVSGCTDHHYRSPEEMEDGRLVAEVNATRAAESGIVAFDVNWAAPANLQLCFLSQNDFLSVGPRGSLSEESDALQRPAAHNFVLHFCSVPGSGDGLEVLPDAVRALFEDPGVLKVGYSCAGDVQKMNELFGVRTEGRVLDGQTKPGQGLPKHYSRNKYRDAYSALLIFKEREAMGRHVVELPVSDLLGRKKKVVTDSALLRLATAMREGRPCWDKRSKRELRRQKRKQAQQHELGEQSSSTSGQLGQKSNEESRKVCDHECFTFSYTWEDEQRKTLARELHERCDALDIPCADAGKVFVVRDNVGSELDLRYVLFEIQFPLSVKPRGQTREEEGEGSYNAS